MFHAKRRSGGQSATDVFAVVPVVVPGGGMPDVVAEADVVDAFGGVS